MTAGYVIQWTAFIVCAVFAILRLPGAVRGQNRGVTACLGLMAVGTGLGIDVFYLTADRLLGGVNVANLLIRFCVYALVLILGVKIAAAFNAQKSARFVNGPIGWTVLGLTVVLTVYFFIVSDLPYSSTGLMEFGGQQSVQVYGGVGRTYPGYVGACLLVPVFAAALDRRRSPAHRVGAALIGLGLAHVAVFAALRLVSLELGAANVILPFNAMILLCVGLAAIWVSNRRSSPPATAGLLARVNEY